MKQQNHALGQLTENLAAEYLTSHGYLVIEHNYSNKFGEIDLIAKHEHTLVFVEVKAKTGLDFGHPEEMVTPKKLAKVRRMADLYLKDLRLPCRIDVVAIVLDSSHQPIRLTHYPNVY